MNKYLKFVLLFLVCIVFMLGVYFAYNALKDNEDILNELQGQQQEIQPAMYEKATDFEIFDINKKSVKLSNYIGRPIVINAWTSWCNPCRTELPDFQKAYEAYSGDVEFLMINLPDGISETYEGTLQFIEDNNYTFPVYFDLLGKATTEYEIYSIPRTLFINESGEIVKDYTGMINDIILENEIQNIL